MAMSLRVTHPIAVRHARRQLALALAALCAALGLCALAARPAQASSGQISIMMDDDLMLYRTDRERVDTLKKMKAVGVDAVRATVLWSVVGQGTEKKFARGRRKLADPAYYPPGNWGRYDAFVQEAYAAGLVPFFNVTGPGPSYAHEHVRSKRDQHTWKPKAPLYGQFVQALGQRYSGRYVPFHTSGAPLPRVVLWSLWNEPNQAGWLEPQFEGGIPVAPILYRRLFSNGRAALATTGHDQDIILGGETAPVGSDIGGARTAISPVLFIRELFCQQSNGTPYSGADATRRSCNELSSIGSLKMSAWAHHPYTKTLAPTQPNPERGEITIANISDLGNLLDDAAAKTHFLASGLPIISSEFGYRSNPPNPIYGVPLDTQAEWINVGDRLAYDSPRVVGQTQFLLRDAAPNRKAKKGSKRYWATFQTGLVTLSGNPKPALAAYAFPFDVERGPVVDEASGTRIFRVWGQLRFRPHNVASDVQVQARLAGSTTWVNVGDEIHVTNSMGFFDTQRLGAPQAIWRAVWTDPALAKVFSREAHVGF